MTTPNDSDVTKHCGDLARDPIILTTEQATAVEKIMANPDTGPKHIPVLLDEQPDTAPSEVVECGCPKCKWCDALAESGNRLSEDVTALTATVARLASELAAVAADNDELLQIIDKCNPEVRYALDQTSSASHELDLKLLLEEIKLICTKPHPGTTLLAEVDGLRRERDRFAGEIDAAIALYEASDDERLEEMHKNEAEAERWKAEGDMYGWNFWKGVASGMTSASIVFYRVRRRLAAIRAALTPAQEPQ